MLKIKCLFFHLDDALPQKIFYRVDRAFLRLNKVYLEVLQRLRVVAVISSLFFSSYLVFTWSRNYNGLVQEVLNLS